MLDELVSVADNVWIVPCDPNAVQPNVGIVKCGDECILIDAGNSPQQGASIASEIVTAGLGRLHSLIYTHHHWDHIHGAMSHNPFHAVAHVDCATILRNQSQLASAGTDTGLVRLVQPTLTFSHEMALYLDDVTIMLQHVGGRHAEDSIVVKIPSASVMFLGDCYYPPVPSERAPGDEDLHIPMLEGFLTEDYDIYIDGHGKPRSHSQLAAMVAEEKDRQGKK